MKYNKEENGYRRRKLSYRKRKKLRLIRGLFILSLLTIIIIIIISLATTYYAVKIEPYRVTTERVEIGESTDNKNELKIVQFSDTHIKEDFTHENLSKVVDEINDTDADIVIFTGDLYDNYSVYHDDENIKSELSRVEANIAKIAIWGNRDYGGGASREYQNIMESSGFNLLKNESEIFVVRDTDIKITALDDALLGNPEMPKVYSDEQMDYNILLTHEPDVIDNYDIEEQDLILAGHTHGGQINIPFLPFINDRILQETEFSTNYESGINILDEEENQMLYINTGIGTTKYSVRLGVVPEITEFTIYIDN